MSASFYFILLQILGVTLLTLTDSVLKMKRMEIKEGK